MPSIDICFSPELLPLYDLRGKVAVIVDVLRATSSMVTALAAGVTHIVPFSELAECRAMAAEGYLTAAERDGMQAEGVDLGNSPFGYLDGVVPVAGRAVADYLRRQQQDVVVVCAGWKGHFCLEDTLFGGALAQRLQPDFDPTAADSTLAALDLWEKAQPDVAAYLLKSAHVRRLNHLEAHQDMAFCVQLDEYDLVPVWREGKLKIEN